uniref:Uncharacterized protein n=1 Tax=Avena sativa TaxID=4498 RepID=A0ACD5WLA7_AVESA
MDRRRPEPEPEPAAIDITWVSCRGVRSSLPFHTPCLYASVCVTSSACGRRRPHRVKTPTDRAGGENPEWDDRLRLHFPDDASPASPASDQKAARAEEDHGGVLVVKFELKAEVAVLGDVLAASAVVPVSDLVADGRTRRVSYQLAASSDARQHNGVISFSYAFRFQDDGEQDEDRRSNGEPLTPPSPVSPAPASASSGMYPVLDWPPMEQLAVYPPLMEQTAVYPPLTAADTVRSRYDYASTTPPQTPVQPAAIYPPSTRELSARGIYPTVGEPDNSLYPSLDLDPVICYSPATVPCYGGGFRYPAMPDHRDARCLYS